MHYSKSLFLAFTLGVLLMQVGCRFVGDQLHDKVMEEQHLKPGALDVQIATSYRTYNYKFLDKYRVTHDWIHATQCRYAKNYFKGINPNPDMAEGAVLPISEWDGHTWQRGGFLDKDPPINIDRYVRPEWQMGPDRDGNYRTVKGFAPICGQVWGGTSHSLSVSLVRLPLDAAIKRYTEPDVPLEKQSVGANTWITQTTEIKPREINTYGGSYLAWLLPVGDTGYTFVFKLGANQDSLKHPQAHAQMQAIFRHLIESVKIEPLP